MAQRRRWGGGALGASGLGGCTLGGVGQQHRGGELFITKIALCHRLHLRWRDGTQTRHQLGLPVDAPTQQPLLPQLTGLVEHAVELVHLRRGPLGFDALQLGLAHAIAGHPLHLGLKGAGRHLGRDASGRHRGEHELLRPAAHEAVGRASAVGDALTRVTGLSLVGGKYVYVRGLGERYSSTLLDGSRLSSPVPFQKTVPLDIVPKSIVRSLLVQKTYSAQYPGDFSGGLVDIRTRATPENNYFELKLGVGGNSQTTGGEGLDYRGGTDDNWGYDDGTRHQPENIQVLSSEEFEAIGFPEDRALGASFYNFWDIRERDLKPEYTGETEFGLRRDFDNGMAVGLLVAGR